MAISTRLYLDTRAVKRGMEAPIRLSVNKHGQTAYINLSVKVLPNQWNKTAQKVIEHPNKVRINSYLANRKTIIDNLIWELLNKGELTTLTASQIKEKILEVIEPKRASARTFVGRLELYIERQTNPSTRQKYEVLLKRVLQYDRNARQLSFEQIGKDWLVGFDLYLQSTCPRRNTRNIYFRNIRTIFNDAIDNEITSHYPFRSAFKIKHEETMKRSLSIDELCRLLTYPVAEFQKRYVDYFFLDFCLIGINMADLYSLSEIKDGRIEYRRAKTSRLYSIKVEPEALNIINKYRGKKKLLDLADRCSTVNHCTSRANKGLKSIGPTILVKNPKFDGISRQYKFHTKRTPIFPELSMYWARHTWATIAAELEIPAETISAALGHSGYCDTTSIYIKFNRNKIDEANRKVLDYVKLKLEAYKQNNPTSE